MNAASSVHGQPAWISSTGCCGWRLSRSKRPAGRACGTRLSGSPPPEWMCTGTPLAEATSSVRSSSRSRTGLACARVSRKPSSRQRVNAARASAALGCVMSSPVR